MRRDERSDLDECDRFPFETVRAQRATTDRRDTRIERLEVELEQARDRLAASARRLSSDGGAGPAFSPAGLAGR